MEHPFLMFLDHTRRSTVGRTLLDELITRPEESYRLCCVVVCDLETSRIGAPYIYDVSNLRVKCINQVPPPKKIVKFGRILSKGIYAKVKISKYLSSDFKVKKVLRQGDAIAPLLFNAVLEISIRRSKVETQEPHLTNVVKLWQMLMMSLKWE